MGFARIENDSITWAQRNSCKKEWKAEISQDVLTVKVVITWLMHNKHTLAHATVNMEISVSSISKDKGCKYGSIDRSCSVQTRCLQRGELNYPPGRGHPSDFISGDERTIQLFILIGDGAYPRPGIVTQLRLFQADANASGIATRQCTKSHIVRTGEDVTGIPTD